MAGAEVVGNRFTIAERTPEDLRPHHPGLAGNAAICLVGCTFRGQQLRTTGVVLQDNRIEGAGLAPLAVLGDQEWTREAPRR